TPLFDPLLAKIICHAPDRNTAIQQLDTALAATEIYGIETNIAYVRQVLDADVFRMGNMTTRYLNTMHWQPLSVDVLVAGTHTSIQDYPARQGYEWLDRMRLSGRATPAATCPDPAGTHVYPATANREG
ncbi:MAG: hypothetical protein E6Q76_04680, partial [Rhizobium sp.]